MKRFRVIGVGVVAALAMTGVFVSSAAAAPEFLHLGAAPSLDGITGVSLPGGIVLNDTALKAKIKCSKASLEGEIEPGGSTSVEEVHTTLKGCYEVVVESTGKSVKCKVKSPGRPSGTVRSKRLVGELGEVLPAEAASERGLDLEPEVGTVLAIVEAPNCKVPNASIEGSIIGEMTPKGPPEATTKSLVYATAGGIQKIQKFSTALKDVLETFGTEITLTGTIELKFEEPIEVT